MSELGDYRRMVEEPAIRSYEATIAHLRAQVQTLTLIDQLRAEDGHSVMIHCDNPDGTPNCAVEVCGDWTEWEFVRFTGATVLEALQAAKAQRP